MDIIPDLSLHTAPLLAITCYLLYPKQLRINSTLLYWLSVIHNGGLVAFSAWTFVSLSQILYTEGVVFQSNYYFQNPWFDTVIYLFYLSKYYEFFDTFLLYLNGKTPIFLQKYHHIGAVICWHLLYVYKVDCLWIPSIANSFVHTIMYSYYLGCLLKINQVRFIKKYITSLQLVQLFIPNFICLYYYMPPVESIFNYNLISSLAILVLLFFQLINSIFLQSSHCFSLFHEL